MLSSCSEAVGSASDAGEASGGPRGPAAAQLATAAPSVVASTGVGQPQLPAEPVGAAAPWVDLPSLLLGHILSFLYNEDPGLVRTLMQSSCGKGLHAAACASIYVVDHKLACSHARWHNWCTGFCSRHSPADL